MNSRSGLWLSAFSLLVAAPAWAQEPVPVISQEQSQAQPPPPVPARQGRGIEYGLHLVVPIFVAQSNEIELKPGFGLQGRVGWEFPSGLTPELSLGVMYNTSDGGLTRDLFVIEEYSLLNVWVSAGARWAWLNPSAFVPFIGAALALNIWSDAQREDGLGGTDGGAADKGVITIGVIGTLGVAFEVNPWIAIEAGAQFHYTASPKLDDIAAEPKAWLSPFAGATLYY